MAESVERWALLVAVLQTTEPTIEEIVTALVLVLILRWLQPPPGQQP